jgi:hypothetical protein
VLRRKGFLGDGQRVFERDGVCAFATAGGTDSGRLALVPGRSRVGDVVVLVRWGDMPLVVRRVRGEGEEEDVGSWSVEFKGMGEVWTLVGDCYVHGIMYGEAWEGGPCGEVDLV